MIKFVGVIRLILALEVETSLKFDICMNLIGSVKTVDFHLSREPITEPLLGRGQRTQRQDQARCLSY